jgi:hypothetical protein
MINLIHILLNVSSLAIPPLRRDIVVIVLFFVCYFTSADVTFVESLSYFPVDASFGASTLEPDVTSFPLPVPYLSESVLLPPPSPAPLQVYTRLPCSSAPAPPPSSLPSSDSLALASGSLPIALRKGTRSCTTHHPISQFASLVLYLLSILALFSIFLLFPLQRQCMMPYLTLVGGKLWNWK